MLTVPFFHAFAGPLALISALRSGHTTYIMQRYDQSDYLGAIERLKITETALAPPLIVRFLGLPAEQLTMLSSLELVWCGVSSDFIRIVVPALHTDCVLGSTTCKRDSEQSASDVRARSPYLPGIWYDRRRMDDDLYLSRA